MQWGYIDAAIYTEYSAKYNTYIYVQYNAFIHSQNTVYRPVESPGKYK